jgi:cytochrome c
MLVGGVGSLATKSAKRTIGSYWPYAATIFDYVRRAMPLDRPGSLTADEVYALSAWLLHANGIVAADAVMDAKSLPAVRMPNRDGFIVADTKPDFIAERCMQDCK